MVAYKLVYFNIMGRAEPARILFHAAGVDFEDHRFSGPEEFAALKPTLFFGQVPILYVDGKELAQSLAIYRYLGRTFGMAGKDDWEGAKCDMYADGMADIMTATSPWWAEKDPAKKASIMAELVADKVGPLCGRLDKVIGENGAGHLVGSSLSWADVFVFCALDFLGNHHQGLTKDFPNLQKMMANVAGEPKVKAYLDKRPKSAV